MKQLTPPHLLVRQVLVVEDEVRLRNMLMRAVQEMGFAPVAVSTAEAALRLLHEQEFGILIFDNDLPGISGMEMLQLLRNEGSPIQAIFLSGFGDLDTARRAIHLEVVDYLTKPCPLGSLERALERARTRCLQRKQVEVSVPAEPEPPLQSLSASDESQLSLEQLEQQHILAVLRKNGGKRAATAAELGISLRKLYYRLGEYQRQGLL